MANFQPISRERAEQLRKVIRQATSTDKGLEFDLQTGQCRNKSVPLNSVPLRPDPRNRRGVIGKFDTHYTSRNVNPVGNCSKEIQKLM